MARAGGRRGAWDKIVKGVFHGRASGDTALRMMVTICKGNNLQGQFSCSLSPLPAPPPPPHRHATL